MQNDDARQKAQEHVRALLESFEVPALRRDLSKAENRTWLIGNLAIRNAENPHLRTVLTLLRKVF